MIEIGAGSGPDVAAIMPVMADAFDRRFGEAWTAAQCLATLSMPGSRLLLAKKQQSVAGFALSRWVGDEEELLLIGVARQHRRQGVARKLIESLADIASNQDIATVFLEVREGNDAQYFYREMGFLPIGRRPSYYRSTDGVFHDSVTMALTL